MSVLSLAAAKAHLNITRDVNDSELQAVIDSAEAIISNHVGPLAVGDSVTARISGSTPLVLPALPVDSVTGITSADGQDVDLTTVTLNQAAGLVYFNDGCTRFCHPFYDVTFTSGWDTLPADLMLAIKEFVRFLFAPQRGGGGTRANSPIEAPIPGKDLPYRVEQLVGPYRRINVGAA